MEPAPGNVRKLVQTCPSVAYERPGILLTHLATSGRLDGLRHRVESVSSLRKLIAGGAKIPRPFLKTFRIPFASTRSEEVPAVNVDRAGKAAYWVRN